VLVAYTLVLRSWDMLNSFRFSPMQQCSRSSPWEC